MSTSLLCGMAIAALGQSAPDRSGEPALKKILEAMGNLRSARMLVSQSSRESSNSDFFEGNSATFYWDGPQRFMVETSNLWGDGSRFVGNGDSSMRDPLDWTQPVILRKLGSSVIGSVPELAAKGEWQFIVAYFLDGVQSLDKLAPKGSSIKVREKDGSIEISKSPFGNLTVHVFEYKSQRLVSQFEYDNIDSKIETHKKYPDWVDMPMAGTMDFEAIRYEQMGRKLDVKLFSVAPPKGALVSDERKKP